MKRIYFISAIILMMVSACDDYLDKTPLANVSTATYLYVESDLAAYAANLYANFPAHSGYSLGIFSTDNNSDNQVGSTPNTQFVKGQIRVGATGGDWDFTTIRSVNYFLGENQADVPGRYERGELSGSDANIKHYIGEMYFFRAYLYFNKLVSMGDFPILTDWISDDYTKVVEASRRRPRNEVARFILSDLDKAYELMLSSPPQSNRLTKACAALLKSRVALFEGTWEKHHKGTALVPGGSGWPGATKDYLSGYSIDIDQEINYFLEQAITAAQIVADEHPLHNDYEAIFNSFNLSSMKEVLLWKAYSTETNTKVYHFMTGYIQRNGGGNSGYTRSMIESFLMQNGLPIYAQDAGYAGDKTYADVFTNRDPRLNYVCLNQYDKIQDLSTFSDYHVNGVGYYYRAPLFVLEENRCPTGYSVKKGLNTQESEGPTKESTVACVVFRAAEAYLNYMEAYYERYGSLGGQCDTYWKALRERAGMDVDYRKTISNTDVSKENDLACYSGISAVDATLYNIRRERRIELAAEGFRYRDLKRWRALDHMKNYHVQGINLWDEMQAYYTSPSPVPAGDAALDVIELIENGAQGTPNVSAKKDGVYLMPFRANSGNIAYEGFNWTEAKYLTPIATEHFRLTTAIEGDSDYTTSSIYQNPGWSTTAGSLPDGE